MSAHEAFARPLWIPPDPVPGVNLVGFLEAESGLGEIARRLGRGLQHAEIPFSAISYRRTPSRLEGAPEFPISHDAPYDTNLVWKHAVPKSARYRARRISVTLRAFASAATETPANS